MNIKIFLNRHIEKDYFFSEGTQNENNITNLTFDIPEKYNKYEKKIVFITEDGNFWDYILDNKYIVKNNITIYNEVQAYVWLTYEDDDFRSKEFTLKFYENENPDSFIPGGKKFFGDERIFYWDGESTENNLENIKFWQNIYDLYKQTQKGVVVIATDSSENKTAVFNIDFNKEKSTYNFETMKETLLDADIETGTNLYYIYFTVNIIINDDKIISTSSLIYNQNGRLENKFGDKIGNSFLPTDIFNNPEIEAPINYIPTEAYQPTNKKYVDEEINKKLSGKLTRKIVDALPEIGEPDIIYLILKQNDINEDNVEEANIEEDNIYNEYMYINGNWEKIGDTQTDLTGYATEDYVDNIISNSIDENTIIFSWNGKSSNDNPENLKLFQKIIDTFKKGKTIYLFTKYLNVTNEAISIFKIDTVNFNSNNNYYSILDTVLIEKNITQKIYNVYKLNSSIKINISNGIVTNVYEISKNKTEFGKTLYISSKIGEIYVPLVDTDPANKKYVDDTVKGIDLSSKADVTYVDSLVGDINSVLDSINGEVILNDI